jgi:asparaginyl-tRNA synthetase
MALMDKLNFVLKTISNAYNWSYWYFKNCTQTKKKKIQIIINVAVLLQSEHERYLVEKHFKCP